MTTRIEQDQEDDPRSGDEQWFDAWFERAWRWLSSEGQSDPGAPPVAAATPAPLELVGLPPIVRSSGTVRGERRHDPLAGSTVRSASRTDALRKECADRFSSMGDRVAWLRRDRDEGDRDTE
jgi:hypothetical protein